MKKFLSMFEEYIPMLRALAGMTPTKIDDGAVDVLEWLLSDGSSDETKEWLLETCQDPVAFYAGPKALPSSIHAEVANAGFDDEKVLAFIRLILPFLRETFIRWWTGEEEENSVEPVETELEKLQREKKELQDELQELKQISEAEAPIAPAAPPEEPEE